MDNIPSFLYPSFEPSVSKDLIAPGVSSTYQVVKLIWGSLLGKSNKELEIDSLLNSPKFIVHVEKTRQAFIKNHTDLAKYPKLDKKIWE